MNIYSIEEIVKATNSFLEPKVITKLKKSINKKTSIKIETDFLKNENSHDLEKIPCKLEKIIPTNNTMHSFNYKINIKPEIKDKIVNELYIYIKKKIKKKTLILIIEEQLEIKNLKNKINLLKENQNKLKNNYELSLKNNLNQITKNEEQFNLENKELKSKLNQTIKNEEQLNLENKELKSKLNQTTKNEEQLNLENKELKSKLNQTTKNVQLLNVENKELKEKQKNNDDILEKNKYLEINNSNIKNTLSEQIANNKKLQKKIDLIDTSKNLDSQDVVKKIKFYQDENVRLSSDLLYAQNNNKNIKENLSNIQFEKEIIAHKIEELNKSIGKNLNIVPTSFVKNTEDNFKNDINKLNDKEKKNLDEVINGIFSKM